MKRFLPIILIGIAAAAILISKNSGTYQEENEPEHDDGIKLAQEQEFNSTKDPALGYVPQYQLVDAVNTAMQERLSPGNFANRTENLVWTERGSNADSAGPSNGNGRPGSPAPVTSGRMRAVWVDLDDLTNRTIWVGGVDGGLWKTTGINTPPANWTPVNDFFSNLAIASISQDPINHNIMYFGTGEKTFNSDAVRGGGVWKSTDHGVTWNLLNNTTGFWNVSKIIVDSSENVYVATIGSGSGLQRSTDGGATWSNITPTTAGGGTRIADIVLSSNGRLHVSKGYQSTANQSGYFYSDNPATVTSGTWTQATVPFSCRYNVAIAVVDSVVYVLPSTSADQTPVVYRSTDGGNNWTATTSISTTGNNALSSGQAWYCLAIGIDPNNRGHVIVGGLNCYNTADSGKTWNQMSVWVSGISGTVSNYIHADQHFVAWNGTQVLIGSDGGIFYSTDNGTTFADRNKNLRIKQFYSCAIHPSSTDYFLAGAQDNGVHRFTTPGLSTSTEVTGGDGAFVAIDQNEPSFQFGSYTYNHYHRSTDGGTSWSDFNFYKGSTPANRSDFGSFINPYDYDNAGNVLFAGADTAEFFRWTNPQTLAAGTYYNGGAGFPAGVSLVSITSLGTGVVRSVKVSPYTADRVYFGTHNGKVIQVDNASTIASGSAGVDISGTSFPAGTVSCINTGTNDQNLIVTFSNYGVSNVWVTTDGGTNWTTVDGNLPNMPVRWAMFYPNDNTKVILATEMGIFETASLNGGSTIWTQDNTFPFVRTDMLKYRSSDNTVLAATHGRGLWTATIPIVLPVTLLNFYGQLSKSEIDLEWSTSTESNSKLFDLQKSNDGFNFYSIGTVNASGTSNFQHNYSFADKRVNQFNYYRLKMVDLDGHFIYSKTILIKEGSSEQNLQVFNNPFESSIRVQFAKQPKNKINIELISATGVRVYRTVLSNAVNSTIDFSGRYLSTGVYFLRAEADGEIFVRKLVKK
ncbi:MAG: T9SS type A sorting domain-containing protein [Bacteroidetes bacterium]|nr:T9SS type A sorting domain-containing protein [Bacteroidota bacterium]MBS1930193.1 T9SS type A sorting domain-containing protein [Bacteroidota bacterium]